MKIYCTPSRHTHTHTEDTLTHTYGEACQPLPSRILIRTLTPRTEDESLFSKGIQSVELGL